MNNDHPWSSPNRFLFFSVLLICLIYSCGFNGAFIYDDIGQIVERTRIQNIFNLHDVIFNGLRQHRVWQNLSFGLNWTISGGAIWSFKLFSLFLHLVNSWILLKWLKQLFSDRPLVPVIATALFLIHPLQIQSVTYVMGVTTLFQAFFYLLSLYWYSQYRLNQMGGLLIILFFSLFSKETSVLIPLVLVGYEFLLIRKPGEAVQWKKWGMLFLVPLLMLPIYEALKDPISMFKGTSGFDLFPFFKYLLIQFYYQLYYFALVFNPGLQSLIHELPIQDTFQNGISILGLLTWLLALYFIFFRSKRYPRIVFLLVFYLISYWPTNSFLQMLNPFAEYRLYLSNVILLIFLAIALIEIYQKLIQKKYITVSLFSFLIPFVFYFSFFTFYHVLIWKDEVKVYTQSVKQYPYSAVANQALVVSLVNHEKIKDAYYHFTVAKFLGGKINSQVSEAYFTMARKLHGDGMHEMALNVLIAMEQDHTALSRTRDFEILIQEVRKDSLKKQSQAH